MRSNYRTQVKKMLALIIMSICSFSSAAHDNEEKDSGLVFKISRANMIKNINRIDGLVATIQREIINDSKLKDYRNIFSKILELDKKTNTQNKKQENDNQSTSNDTKLFTSDRAFIRHNMEIIQNIIEKNSKNKNLSELFSILGTKSFINTFFNEIILYHIEKNDNSHILEHLFNALLNEHNISLCNEIIEKMNEEILVKTLAGLAKIKEKNTSHNENINITTKYIYNLINILSLNNLAKVLMCLNATIVTNNVNSFTSSYRFSDLKKDVEILKKQKIIKKVEEMIIYMVIHNDIRLTQEVTARIISEMLIEYKYKKRNFSLAKIFNNKQIDTSRVIEILNNLKDHTKMSILKDVIENLNSKTLQEIERRLENETDLLSHLADVAYSISKSNKGTENIINLLNNIFNTKMIYVNKRKFIKYICNKKNKILNAIVKETTPQIHFFFTNIICKRNGRKTYKYIDILYKKVFFDKSISTKILLPLIAPNYSAAKNINDDVLNLIIQEAKTKAKNNRKKYEFYKILESYKKKKEIYKSKN